MDLELLIWLIMLYLVVDGMITMWKIQTNKTENFWATFTVNLFWIVILIVKGVVRFARWIPIYIDDVKNEIKNI